ncbi:Endonuclease/exonuclease/phosphatase [Lactarius quietus]|nr:Endonuclease/exonuclease/phosphatase [Lactarius quietus]
MLTKRGITVKPPRDLRHEYQPVLLRLSEGCAGTPGNDAVDYTMIRDDWLYSKSWSSIRKNSEQKQLSIRAGTFNVNGSLPFQDLSTWLDGALSPHDTQNDKHRHSTSLSEEPSPDGISALPLDGKGDNTMPEQDLLVVALQEVDQSTETLFYTTSPAREDAWITAILAALGEKAEKYQKLASKQLVGILLIILVKRDLHICFTGVGESSVASGIMGNKGAVAIQLTYRPYPTPSAPTPTPIILTFVDSHLAAFEDHLDRRNADFHDISRRLTFGPCAEYARGPSGDGPTMLDIYESDFLLWMLRSTIHYAKAFAEFEEHPINFLPTYRFNSHLQTDSLGYDTKRKPAWTDRILHMSSSFVPAIQRSYDAHPHITMSDHRPISAEFLVNIPCVDSLALDSVANDLYKSIASFDSEHPSGIPLLKVDDSTLNFGKVSYSTPISRSLCIQNIGKVPAAFRFLPRDLSSPIHPRWLKIGTATGFLLPGEEMNIKFTILVSPAIAAPLNLKIEKLSTLLIIHTISGQDHFLSLNGETNMLRHPLIRVGSSARPNPRIERTRDLLPESQAHNSSREFTKLMAWLMSHDVETVHDLFITPGDEELASQIRESLDTGADLPPYPMPKAPHTVDANYARTVASVLLAFLGALPESLIPPSLHQWCCEVTSRDAAFEMLSAFPPSSVNVWISMTAFLHLITLKSQHPAKVGDKGAEKGVPALEVTLPTNSQSHAETLASIFAPILLRDDIDAAVPVSLLGKKKFLLLFMEGP